MASYSVSGKELKEMISLSKKKDLAFAFCPGGKVEEDILAIDRRKEPNVLQRSAKAEGTGAKVAFGRMKMDGVVIYLTCEKELTGLAKKFKKCLKFNNIRRNVVVLDMNGNVLEQEVEDLPEEAEGEDAPAADQTTPQAADAPEQQQSAAPAEAPGGDMQELAARVKALRDQIADVAGPTGEKLQKVFETAVESLKAKDLDTARKSFDGLDKVLAKLGAAAAAPPNEEAPKADAGAGPLKKLQEAAIQVAQRVKALPEGEARAALADQLRAFSAAIQSGEVETAVAVLRTLQADLKQAEADPGAGESDPLTIWNTAKEATDASVTQLQNKLNQFPIDDPDLKRIADQGLNGVTEGNQVALMRRLFEFQSAKGADKAKAAAELKAQSAQYRGFLQDSGVIALCENNPFGVTVNLRGPLIRALDAIDRAATAAA